LIIVISIGLIIYFGWKKYEKKNKSNLITNYMKSLIDSILIILIYLNTFVSLLDFNNNIF